IMPFSIAVQKLLLLLVMIRITTGPVALRGFSNAAAAELAAAPAGAVPPPLLMRLPELIPPLDIAPGGGCGLLSLQEASASDAANARTPIAYLVRRASWADRSA